jgi:hypothetical protein
MKKGKNAPPSQRSRMGHVVRPFPPRRDYASLSLKDLIEARDAHHVHLSSLENVVATAVGRYLIHERDWYAKHPPDRPRPKDFPLVGEPRTLVNTVIRPWSWPAVLVFVRDWGERAALEAQAVPRALHLPDGRVVPTCVVLATPDEAPPPPGPEPSSVSTLLGGGYACQRVEQGVRHFGTIACLARKNGTYYALTSRHVAGGVGEGVGARVRGLYRRVGVSSDQTVGRVLQGTVFPGFAGTRTYLTLDAGLVRIDDLRDWTSQVFGIGEIGPIFDATEQALTLDLIGTPVRAFGAASGVMEGDIRALFFRYQSLGGHDLATDLLIAPRRAQREHRSRRPAPPLTRPGDSGAVWFYDPPHRTEAETDPELAVGDQAPDRGARARRLRPVAMQWGGERLVMPDGSTSAFALASFLSTVCRTLDVELERGWSTGHDEYWGKIGHFSIGWKACDLLDAGKLGTLMRANQVRIGFGDETISRGSEFRVGRDGFVPLADVPDYVWVTQKGARPFEGMQHFADVDHVAIDGGKTLIDRCIADPSRVSASAWKTYFDGFAAANVGPDGGCLPFRVWQLWEAMVEYLKKRDVLRFVAAAGVLSHYAGDASQPLHCSYLHHGVPPAVEVNGRSYPAPRGSAAYEEFKASRAAKIHGIYEEMMLEIDTTAALAAVDQALGGAAKPRTIQSGWDAAVETVRLMNASRKRLSPAKIIEVDDPELGPKARAKALWNDPTVRDGTIASLALSIRFLADLWTSAWEAGGGDRLASAKLELLDEDELDAVYRRDRKFAPSLSLDEMAESGQFEAR